MKFKRRSWDWVGGQYGSRFAPMQANTWEAGPAAAPELFSDRKAYRKVLKHGQLKMCQFRTVSRSADRDSLGKEMGKLLGKPVQTSDNWPQCSLADFMHLMYMPAGLWCDRKQCRALCGNGVCR